MTNSTRMKKLLFLPVLKAAYLVIRIYWRIFTPRSAGVRCLVLKDDNLLLVKHSYQPYYFAPGGAIKGSEPFDDAVRREVKEETGVVLGTIELFGIYQNTSEHKHDIVVLFYSDEIVEDIDASVESLEIESNGWFPLDDLPEHIAPGIQRRINELKSVIRTQEEEKNTSTSKNRDSDTSMIRDMSTSRDTSTSKDTRTSSAPNPDPNPDPNPSRPFFGMW